MTSAFLEQKRRWSENLWYDTFLSLFWRKNLKTMRSFIYHSTRLDELYKTRQEVFWRFSGPWNFFWNHQVEWKLRIKSVRCAHANSTRSMFSNCTNTRLEFFWVSRSLTFHCLYKEHVCPFNKCLAYSQYTWIWMSICVYWSSVYSAPKWYSHFILQKNLP